jgi:hypothetical protein
MKLVVIPDRPDMPMISMGIQEKIERGVWVFGFGSIDRRKYPE